MMAFGHGRCSYEHVDSHLLFWKKNQSKNCPIWIALARSPGFEPGSSAWKTSENGSLACQGLEIDY